MGAFQRYLSGDLVCKFHVEVALATACLALTGGILRERDTSTVRCQESLHVLKVRLMGTAAIWRASDRVEVHLVSAWMALIDGFLSHSHPS